MNNSQQELRPFNWRPNRPHGARDHMRVFGGWWSQVQNRSPLLELSLHAKVELAKENNRRSQEFIDEALASLLRANSPGDGVVTLADFMES